MAELTSDRVNPYRYGVLEGNHVEERFALDHLNRNDQKPLPWSTMKCEYRWYNSTLFNQREDLLKRYPELVPDIHMNKKLKPFLEKPSHILAQERNEADQKIGAAGSDPAASAGPGIGAGSMTSQGPPGSTQVTPTLFVCCPQEENRARHGMDPGDPNYDASIEQANGPLNDKNNFSQYGGWVVNGYQGRHTMYTRDREGLSDKEFHLEGVKKDSQAPNCSKHILFGHGNDVPNFRDREYRSIHNLGMDNKVKSKVFLDSHFHPEVYLSQVDQSRAVGQADKDQPSNSTCCSKSTLRNQGEKSLLQTQVMPMANKGSNGTGIGTIGSKADFTSSGFVSGQQKDIDFDKVSRYGEVETLKENKKTTDYKFYDDFTKRFDQTHKGTKLREPYYHY